jgi:hypothetical protein
VQYLPAMNPTTGSYIIFKRLPCCYALFACTRMTQDHQQLDLQGSHAERGFSMVTVCENIINARAQANGDDKGAHLRTQR